MLSSTPESKSTRISGFWLAACAAAALSACGGGSISDSAVPSVAAQIATGSTTLELSAEAAPEVGALLAVAPAFHAAALILDEPDATDMVDPSASALRAPRRQMLLPGMQSVPTRGLTVQGIEAARQGVLLREQRESAASAVTPMAGGAAVATYSPAQIRAAYGLVALPAAGTTLTPAQAAQLGAGQTIYIVDAMHDPNAAAELAAFNTRFGLSGCTTKPAPTALPLAAASSTACELVVAYSSPTGTLTATAPAYDAGWATEIALDVQWAHAIAPLARIVLIEAPDASVNSLSSAVKLANAMGPGVVSMSFGANEGSWTSSYDTSFAGTNMTYLAATGDSGAAVSWPAVSTKVLAVGGTTLTYSGTAARSEVAWSSTGGGTSAYTPTPSYQTSTVPGFAAPGHRTVADVAMNADPSTGQYVAVMAQGTATPSWISAGGTSLSTPQWAGLIAVANAVRAQAAKPVLGAPHAALYAQAAVATSYASVFKDITSGTHGTCATCTAKAGYDPLTGLGTPNAASLLTALSGVIAPSAAPVVTAATIGGKVGTALSFQVSVTAPNPVTYTMTGAPTGMTISSTGVVTWPTPLAGSYNITVVAKDSKTALSGQGVYTVTIAGPTPPVVSAASVTGKVGTAFTYAVAVQASNPVTYTLSGAPSGMTISSTGILNWPTPLAGTYAVKVVAKDSKTAATGQGVITVAISAPLPPSLTAATINGKPGAALSFQVTAIAPNPVTYTLSGAPSGMTISTAGLVNWAAPVLGTFNVTVIAKDSKTGLTGQAVYTVKIAVAGPVITAAAINGTVGKPVSGLISITDVGATSVSITLTGVPLGMGFAVSGLNITATWASPVAGTYSMVISVVDNLGRTAKVTVPITIK